MGVVLNFYNRTMKRHQFCTRTEFACTAVWFQVAYTFDAGPNACLYLLEQHVAEVAAYLAHCYQESCDTPTEFFTGLPCIPKELSEACFACHLFYIKDCT